MGRNNSLVPPPIFCAEHNANVFFMERRTLCWGTPRFWTPPFRVNESNSNTKRTQSAAMLCPRKHAFSSVVVEEVSGRVDGPVGSRTFVETVVL